MAWMLILACVSATLCLLNSAPLFGCLQQQGGFAWSFLMTMHVCELFIYHSWDCWQGAALTQFHGCDYKGYMVTVHHHVQLPMSSKHCVRVCIALKSGPGHWLRNCANVSVVSGLSGWFFVICCHLHGAQACHHILVCCAWACMVIIWWQTWVRGQWLLWPPSGWWYQLISR